MFFSQDKIHFTISKYESRQIRNIAGIAVLLVLLHSVTFYKKKGAAAFILSWRLFIFAVGK